MNLAPRERRTIMIGAIIVAAVGLWLGAKKIGAVIAGSRRGGDYMTAQFVDASGRIKRYALVSKELKQQTEALKIQVPNEPPEDQMKKLVERFEQLAGRSNVQIRNITQLKAQARTATARAAASTRMELKLDLTAASYAGLVRFIDSLEQASVPIVVDQISITAMGGRSSAGGSRGGRGGGEPQKRQLQAALKIYTYLFPEKAQL
ncbi:MAG: GspMb/PilO family protein [Candidatus Sumerlaeia bacterium]|nr:GspMb/PilO family protein [Candidatus Sumerlaeia bacterium]